ncbi:hypothetical protein ECTW09098_2394, partial [Escherichia coli TW09098]
MRLSARGTVKT